MSIERVVFSFYPFKGRQTTWPPNLISKSITVPIHVKGLLKDIQDK
jgi:hypothetical protein